MSIFLNENCEFRTMRERKGQIAIVVAKAYPDVEQAHRGRKVSVSESFPMVHPGALSHARVIVRYAPELGAVGQAGWPEGPEFYSEARACIGGRYGAR
jgi:hypothetical protein